MRWRQSNLSLMVKLCLLRRLLVLVLRELLAKNVLLQHQIRLRGHWESVESLVWRCITG